VTGIVDSEGNFSINYNSRSKKVSASFKVTQRDHSLIILNDLKNFFNCGNINIDNRKFKTFKYTVSKTSDLINIIIPHFDKYPLVGSKHLDFLDFKKALLIKDNSNSLKEILLIKENMNKKRKYEERWNYLNKLTLNLKPEWVQAFLDGEGTLQCRIAETESRGKFYINVNPTLEIAQSSHDVKVLNAIKCFFGLGYLKPKYDIESLDASKKSRSVSRLIINQSFTIINFFDKYPLFTRKHLDFLDWKKIIELKSKNAHRAVEGLQSMIDLKRGMNRGRLLNSNLLDNPSKLKLVRSSLDIKGYHIKVDKKDYHTKVDKKYNFKLQSLCFSVLFLLIIGSFITYFYVPDLVLLCIKQILFILFFFFLTIFYLDEFKLSENKWVKYSQIFIFIFFVIYILYFLVSILLSWNSLNDSIFHVKPEDIKNSDITLKGSVVLDKEAGTEIAKGISSLGTNIGLGACVGAMAGGVAKGVAKSSLPPFQKAGLIVASGVVGAVLHTGSNAINSHKQAVNSINKSSGFSGQNISSKDVNHFLDNINDLSPLDILLQCIYIFNSISLWLIIILVVQYFLKFYISDKPKLKSIDYLLPSYSDKIKVYIYKLIKLHKNMNIFYSALALILLLISISGSIYFSWELYNNLSSYVDEYIEYHKSKDK
jgi:hypothetical protein